MPNLMPQDYSKMGTEWGNWQKYAGISQDNSFATAVAPPESPTPNTAPYVPSAPIKPTDYSVAPPTSAYGNAPATLGLPQLKSPLMTAVEQHLGE